MTRIALLLCLLACGVCGAQPLPRRADLGASIAPPTDGKPATIRRFRPGSVLEKAGLRVGDQVTADLKRLREGQTLKLAVRRGEERFERDVVLPPMRHEVVEGVDIEYGEVRSSKGYRVRTYTSRRAGACPSSSSFPGCRAIRSRTRSTCTMAGPGCCAT